MHDNVHTHYSCHHEHYRDPYIAIASSGGSRVFEVLDVLQSFKCIICKDCFYILKEILKYNPIS